MPSALRRKPLPKPAPQSDPRFRRVMEQLKSGAAKTKAHPPASRKAAEAAKAAKGPPNERLATGKSKQVDKIKEAKEGKPEQNSFLAMLRAEIAQAMPKTLGDTENFDSAADGMKSGLKGNVAQQKDKSTQDVSGASKQAPAPAGEAKAAQPLPPEGAPVPPKVNAPEGMPAPKSDADISLQDSKVDTDQQMKEAEVTPTQLQKANDPRFSSVIEAKQQVAQNADAGPAKYRAAERTTLASAASQAAPKTRVGAAAMVGVRRGGNAKVLTKQQEQKAKDEAARAKVTAGIESIFTATKQRVELKLAAIDVEVNAMFDSGTEAALSAMKKFVNGKIRDYKIRRYLSIPLVGLARWVKDQFMNLPDEVNVFYEQGRALFQAQMDALIVRVANLVEQRLKEAKTEVAKGKAEIQAFVDKQPKELQQFAKDAQAKVSANFDELEQGIENKKNELASSLAQKYKEGFDKANEALTAIQDANKGFVAAFAEKLAAVIKAIMEFKAKLSAILRKGADTIKLIIADPLSFLGNLISAVKGGIGAFRDNIETHLKSGFMRWLLGNAPPGIAIPTDFSPASVFKLVMGVLGITYEKMRAKAVKLLGPTAVTVIETLVKYVKVLIDGGPAKLWEEVKSDLAGIKEMVIGAFQSWLIATVIKKAVAKIVMMFNPAGAIIQAILAIVSIVQFVVEKAAQIAEFVGSVIDSIHDIATGSVSGAVKKIETALANAVPLLIGFLAALVGLGGVSARLREFVMKIQAKVDAAIDKVLKKIVDFVKKTIGKLLGKEKKGGKDEDPKEAAARAVRGALASGATVPRTQSVLQSVLQKLQPKGLKRLFLGPEDANGDREIIAEASPKKRVAKLIHKKVTVAISARIQVKGEPVLTGMLHGPRTVPISRYGGEMHWPAETARFNEYHADQQAVLGGTGRAATLPAVPQPPRTAAKKGSQPSAGVIVEPDAQSRTLEVLAWNTSRPERGHNVSHAERQFIEWFEGRPGPWLKRVETVDIEVQGRAVCSICEPDLKALRRRFKWMKISWTGSPAPEGDAMEVGPGTGP
ncbi:MAG TPA: hypothetical protein VF883_01700 [Thermoanaerobaculia bacterium]